MTLREAAVELARVASGVRDVADRLAGTDGPSWVLARDLRATASVLDRQAVYAGWSGVVVGEPDPADTSWVRDEPPGIATEMFGS